MELPPDFLYAERSEGPGRAFSVCRAPTGIRFSGASGAGLVRGALGDSKNGNYDV